MLHQGETMSTGKGRALASLCIALAFVLMLSGCKNQTTTTSVGKSVGTYQATSGLANCGNTNPPPLPTDPGAWWSAMPAANHAFPFAGWEAFQTGPGGCATVRLDGYRAVTTFNLAPLSNLKGLVQKAELTVTTHAMPPNAGATLNSGPFGQVGSINLFCPTLQGGAGSLVRFGPAATIPSTSNSGSFQMLTMGTALPGGTATVYT